MQKVFESFSEIAGYLELRILGIEGKRCRDFERFAGEIFGVESSGKYYEVETEEPLPFAGYYDADRDLVVIVRGSDERTLYHELSHRLNRILGVDPGFPKAEVLAYLLEGIFVWWKNGKQGKITGYMRREGRLKKMVRKVLPAFLSLPIYTRIVPKILENAEELGSLLEKELEKGKKLGEAYLEVAIAYSISSRVPSRCR